MKLKTIKLDLEVAFSDDFTPPEKFLEHWKENKCGGCPFFYFQDDYGLGECAILYGDSNDCPIKKYF